jgi:hypothetical protein
MKEKNNDFTFPSILGNLPKKGERKQVTSAIGRYI